MHTEQTGSIQLLNECRDLMTDRLSQSLATMLDKADDVFFELVQKGESTEHRYYFNAMREVRLKRTSIETGFRENFTNLFDAIINFDTGDKQSLALSNTEKEIDIEETIAINSTVGKVKHDCHLALLSLDQRMGELLSSINVERKLNPVRPETICDAFQDACQNIETGIEIKLVLFKLFEKYVASGLQDIYTDIDTLLREKRVNVLSQQGNTSNNYYQEKPQEIPQAPVIRQNAGITRDKNFYVVANRIIKKEIVKHLSTGVVPEFVKDFVINHWSKLLLKIYIKEGVESNAWLHAVDVIDDLVNTVGSGTSASEKLNLAGVMPNLLQRLKYGMNVIPVSPSVREEFISELRQFHKTLLDDASKKGKKAGVVDSEDVTVPSFRTSSDKAPFTDELLADNKPGTKNDFDIE